MLKTKGSSVITSDKKKAIGNRQWATVKNVLIYINSLLAIKKLKAKG